MTDETVSNASSTPASESSYVVVARRYRPRTFDQLVGQDHVAKALQGAIETSRVGHAYLFTGARGVGKTSTARIFAKALNDPGGPTADPSSESDIAQAIDSGEDVDVIEIDGASNRGINEIRSLRANVGVRPSRSRYKIYIIDEVHMLTGEAFNALLKTLEEPPDHVKFIFCTTDPEKIPITVLSRCQRFDFAPVEATKIVQRLREIVAAEDGTAEDEALELLARRAAGSLRDSQSLLEQVLSFSDGHLTADKVHAMLGTADDQRLHALAGAIATRDAAMALAQIDQAILTGIDAGRLTEQLLGYFRDIMIVGVGCDASLLRYAAPSMHNSLADLGKQWGLQTVMAIVGLFDETLVRIRLSVHSRVLLEAAIIQACHLPDLQAIVDLTSAAGAVASQAAKGTEGRKSAESRRIKTLQTGRKQTTEGTNAEKKNGRLNEQAESHNRPQSHSDPVTVAGPSLPSGDDGPNGGGPSQLPPETVPPKASAENASIRASSDQAVRGDETSATRAAGGSPDEQRASEHAASSPRSVESPTLTNAESLTEPDLQRCWPQVLAEMDPMTATLAKAAESVHVPQVGTVCLRFAATATLAMRRCEKPESRDEIIRTLQRVSGKQVSLIFEADTAAQTRKPVVEKPKPRNRMQRMREIEANPLVRSCVELLGAEIVRVDTPRQ